MVSKQEISDEEIIDITTPSSEGWGFTPESMPEIPKRKKRKEKDDEATKLISAAKKSANFTSKLNRTLKKDSMHKRLTKRDVDKISNKQSWSLLRENLKPPSFGSYHFYDESFFWIKFQDLEHCEWDQVFSVGLDIGISHLGFYAIDKNSKSVAFGQINIQMSHYPYRYINVDTKKKTELTDEEIAVIKSPFKLSDSDSKQSWMIVNKIIHVFNTNPILSEIMNYGFWCFESQIGGSGFGAGNNKARIVEQAIQCSVQTIQLKNGKPFEEIGFVHYNSQSKLSIADKIIKTDVVRSKLKTKEQLSEILGLNPTIDDQNYKLNKETGFLGFKCILEEFEPEMIPIFDEIQKYLCSESTTASLRKSSYELDCIQLDKLYDIADGRLIAQSADLREKWLSNPHLQPKLRKELAKAAIKPRQKNTKKDQEPDQDSEIIVIE